MVEERAVGQHEERDPFAPVHTTPRFATPLAIVAFVLALAAASTGTEAIAGPLGMVLGLVAHLKGSRLGMPAAILSGIAMIVGMSITLLLR